MTKQQRKALLIGAAVVVGSYFVRAIVTNIMHNAYYRQQVRLAGERQKAIQAARKRAEAKASLPSAAAPHTNAATGGTFVPAPLPTYPPPSPLTFLTGVWHGRTAVQGRGICDLRLELRAKDDSNDFSGYSTFTCVNANALMSPADRANPRSAILNSMNPDSAVLTGVVENGAISFRVDKTIGTDIHGCAVTSFFVEPLGSGQLSAEWEEGKCRGGHAILRRMRGTS